MDFLDRVDFENHDGVYLSMLNDVARNQFYDKVLREVHNQDCVEIGFGTGLLSMLALKHGARTIVAYESDPDRYVLGQNMIDLLGLKDRITLINKRYDHTCEHNASVIFSETVDKNLWGEGLFASLPRKRGKKFLPGQYFFEIHAVPVVESVALKFCQSHDDRAFAPGVDIDSKFVSFINLLLAKKYQKPIQQKPVLAKGCTVLSPDAGLVNYTNNSTFAGMYTIDTMSWVDEPYRTIYVQISDQPTLLIPRVGMQHYGYRMYLDQGHWGGACDPVIINSPHSRVTVSHDLTTGKISYTIKEKT